MRLIDADVAIGGVKNRCLGQNDVVKVEHSIISMLYMMPTIEIEPQWIPCSERLPGRRKKHVQKSRMNR